MRKIQRRREVLAGFAMILAVASYVTSLLLDFNFVSPYATLQEDLAYLSNHHRNLQISVWAWMATSLITFLSIPPYLLLFHHRLRIFHYVNAIWLLGAAAGFLMMGLAGIELYQELTVACRGQMNRSGSISSLSFRMNSFTGALVAASLACSP